MNALDRRWLVACLCSGTVVWLVLMIGLFVRQPTLFSDALDGVLTAIVMGFWSVLITMFVVGVPLRLAMNLTVPERRRERRLETLWLMIAFLALLAMFVTQFLADPRNMK